MDIRSQQASPFFHEAPLPPEELCNRVQEIEALSELMLGGRYVKLLAPRRYGKTSLLRAVFKRLEKDHGVTCLLCDLDGVVSRADFATRLHETYAKQLEGKALNNIRNYLSAAGIKLTIGAAGLRAQLGAGTDPGQALDTLLDAPVASAQRERNRVVVAFDEFQVILGIEGVDGVLRSRIQHHFGEVAYIFCGSEPSMMERLFSDRARPLYGQALPMRLERLSLHDLVRYIDERFERTNRGVGQALDPLLNIADGHPQRAMLLAHGLWLATPRGSTADYGTYTTALAYAQREVEAECEALWRSLTTNEQRTLRAISLTGGEAVPQQTYESLELSRQTSNDARKRLLGLGHLDKDEEDRYRFIDPLFQLWIKERSP